MAETHVIGRLKSSARWLKHRLLSSTEGWRMRRRARATERRRHARQNDLGRWRRASALQPDWDGRTRLIAELIDEGARVIEFGAGRQVLRTLLPAGCAYLASDLVARDPDTLVCDLNQVPLPSIPAHDVAVFGGVLEYVFDVPALLAHCTGFTSKIILSYAPTGSANPIEIASRRAQGWVTDLTPADLEAAFANSGWRVLDRSEWEAQAIYVLGR